MYTSYQQARKLSTTLTSIIGTGVILFGKYICSDHHIVRRYVQDDHEFPETDGKLDHAILIVIDYCITSQEEVRWTWSRPWGLTRIIFTISQYLPFLYCMSTVRANCPPSPAENINHIISIVAAEEQDKSCFFDRRDGYSDPGILENVLIVLLTYSTVTIIAAVAVNISSNHQLIPGGRTVCRLTDKQNLAVILILTRAAYKWCRDCREIRTSMVITVYGGSMLYISCIIGYNLAYSRWTTFANADEQDKKRTMHSVSDLDVFGSPVKPSDYLDPRKNSVTVALRI
ncbi:hypothetical protein EDB19DRAFT_1951692 [Suillus lakei]|nr:hypothetical protein EDB19DRAFT_1951692 [Suillus lakei]